MKRMKCFVIGLYVRDRLNGLDVEFLGEVKSNVEKDGSMYFLALKKDNGLWVKIRKSWSFILPKVPNGTYFQPSCQEGSQIRLKIVLIQTYEK